MNILRLFTTGWRAQCNGLWPRCYAMIAFQLLSVPKVFSGFAMDSMPASLLHGQMMEAVESRAELHIVVAVGQRAFENFISRCCLCLGFVTTGSVWQTAIHLPRAGGPYMCTVWACGVLDSCPKRLRKSLHTCLFHSVASSGCTCLCSDSQGCLQVGQGRGKRRSVVCHHIFVA